MNTGVFHTATHTQDMENM